MCVQKQWHVLVLLFYGGVHMAGNGGRKVKNMYRVVIFLWYVEAT